MNDLRMRATVAEHVAQLRRQRFDESGQIERHLDPALVALHDAVTRRNAQILYQGTDVETF